MKRLIAWPVSLALPLLLLACAPPPEPPVPADLADIDPGTRVVVEQALNQVRQQPREPRAWRRLAQVYLAHQLSSEAAETLTHLTRLTPTAEAHTLHARALDQLGDAAGRRAAIDAAIAAGGDRSIPYWQGAIWALESGDLDRAASLAETAAAHPSRGYTEPMVLATVRLAQGSAADAASLMRPVISQRPQDGYAHWVLGRALLAAGDEAAATSHLRRAGEALPDFYDPWLGEAEATRADFTARIGQIAAQARSGQIKQAQQTLASLRAMYGDRRELDLAGATLAFRAGEHEQSARALESLRQAWPAWFPPHAQLAQQLLRQSQSPGGRRFLEQARHAAEAATAISPGKADGWAVLARIARAQGDHATEMMAFGTASELATERPGLSLQHAESLALGGQPARALEVLASHDATFAPTLAASLIRVQALVAAGRRGEARAVFEACEREAPKNPRVQQMKQMLKKAGL